MIRAREGLDQRESSSEGRTCCSRGAGSSCGTSSTGGTYFSGDDRVIVLVFRVKGLVGMIRAREGLDQRESSSNGRTCCSRGAGSSCGTSSAGGTYFSEEEDRVIVLVFRVK